MGAYADILNEKCRQLNRDKEELRRRLGERDREMERLQKRLVDSVQECADCFSSLFFFFFACGVICLLVL